MWGAYFCKRDVVAVIKMGAYFVWVPIIPILRYTSLSEGDRTHGYIKASVVAGLATLLFTRSILMRDQLPLDQFS